MSALAQLLSFLTFAPVATSSSPYIRSIHLPTSQMHTEPVSSIYYQSRFFITGTDIIRALLFRFKVLNISIGSMKKFEEGVFSDLRNLKVGVGCQLEEPRSPFLVQLHELGCIRTQKKQKVFFWECVNHEYLFQEALGRERKRQSGGNGQDGVMLMDGGEWQSMIGLWEAHVPLKVTVNPLTLTAMEPKWSADGVDPALLHAASPLKGMVPLMRMTNASKGWMGHSRSSSAASSSIFSRPGTPMVGPSTPSNLGSSLPYSMHHLLNQGSMSTPSLWNDEAIAAVTFEVLKNSPELFATTTESDPMLEYSNWLASVNNTPSDSLLSSDAQSVYSALSMLEESAIQQLDTSNSLFDGIDFDQQEYDIAATNLLFTNLINTSDAASKKRERSNTATSAKSAKRFQPYNLVKGH